MKLQLQTRYMSQPSARVIYITADEWIRDLTSVVLRETSRTAVV